jgi:predicted glycosyltransferase
MTGRIGAMAIDGTLISAADLARMSAEEELHAEWQRKAARVIAASSVDVGDCRTLLDMLGLDTQVVSKARQGTARPKPARKRRATAA